MQEIKNENTKHDQLQHNKLLYKKQTEITRYAPLYAIVKLPVAPHNGTFPCSAHLVQYRSVISVLATYCFCIH